MAIDWIKMRSDLYRDPKVCRIIADRMLDPSGALGRYVNQNCQCDMAVTRNVTRNATVGALVSVWGVLRHRGRPNDDDLVVRSVTLSVIDDIADLPGFGDAMAEVGWAVELDGAVTFPNFFREFNEDPGLDPIERAREKARKRQQRYRESKAENGDTDGPEDGTPAILLHGFPEFHYGWRKQVPALTGAGFRVIVPDQRGYNLSDKPRGMSAYDVNTLAKTLLGYSITLGSKKHGS